MQAYLVNYQSDDNITCQVLSRKLLYTCERIRVKRANNIIMCYFENSFDLTERVSGTPEGPGPYLETAALLVSKLYCLFLINPKLINIFTFLPKKI